MVELAQGQAMDGSGQPPSAGLQAHVESKNFPALIKLLDEQIGREENLAKANLQQLLLNRGFALQSLGLNRKALKVGELARAPGVSGRGAPPRDGPPPRETGGGAGRAGGPRGGAPPAGGQAPQLTGRRLAAH